MKAQRVEVVLMGANGTRTTQITPRPFATRHIKVATPSSPALPPITPELPKPEPTSDNPIGDKLNSVLKQVDCVLEPTPQPKPELTEGQQMIVNALSKTRSHTLDSIARRTGLNALYIMLECRNLFDMGIVAIESTLTVRWYRLEVSCER